MFFPSCWDGVNLDSPDHMSHVAYAVDGEVDGDCPSSHPVKIPAISLFFRIFDYDGGWHTFSDGSGTFHADYVSLRLILTYAGPGTQWLDQGDAARLHDGAAIETLCVRAIPTGDVALFKGRKWARDAPIIHRSPPIADTGQRRLVLVIDPAPNAPMP